MGSLEKARLPHFFAKLQKHTNSHNSLQFPIETNTNGSKTPTTFIYFHTNYDYVADYRYIYFHLFRSQNTFTIVYDL